MTEFISQGVDYLGFLNGRLRDLNGYATIVYELIQNADDAPEATEIIFDICANALIVENNGVFSDCGNQKVDECPWRAEKGHRCDFHRFRNVSGGDKRNESNTIGAFGIGFISVYHLTDHPELLSNGRHWIMHPERSDKRIESRDLREGIAGTRFRLPWASKRSSVRQALGVEPISNKDKRQFAKEIQDILGTALLFLRKLTRIEVRIDNQAVLAVEKHPIDGTNRIKIRRFKSGQELVPTCWTILDGHFVRDAHEYRQQYSSIEQKRKATVSVAVLENMPLNEGLFHAYLPTHHPVGVPVHIQADFYPTSDRKHIIFENGYQRVWNRAAVRAAAATLAEQLTELRLLLGHKQTWQLLQEAYLLHGRARDSDIDKSQTAFWEELRRRLPDIEIVYASTKKWRRIGSVYLLQNPNTEAPSLPILETLSLNIVHPDLAPHANLLQRIGVSSLTIKHVEAALQRAGFDEGVEITQLPEWFQNFEQRTILAKELDILLERASSGYELGTAVVIANDGCVYCPFSVRRAEAETIALFEPLGISHKIASLENSPEILRSVRDFAVDDALVLVENMDKEALTSLWQCERDKYLELLMWFKGKLTFESKRDVYSRRLAAAAIWPSGTELFALHKLLVPGSFRDPLGLADLLDSDVAELLDPFLTEILAARRLTLETYLGEKVPQAFEDRAPSLETAKELLRVMIKNLDYLKNNDKLQGKLCNIRLVPCSDGIIRNGNGTYFRGNIVTNVLGRDFPIALDLDQSSLQNGTARLYRELLGWLGVESEPRSQDIVTRIKDIVQHDPSDENRQSVVNVIDYLAKHWQDRFQSEWNRFDELKHIQWLPTQGDVERWYSSHSVYLVFRSYLFKTEAKFLDVPQVIQQRAQRVGLNAYLGIRDEPTVGQVVNYLIRCSNDQITDLNNSEVLRFLNRHTGDPALNKLLNSRCILVKGRGFVHPQMVFWESHPFGRFRVQLGEDFRHFTDLFSRLGVNDKPTYKDAIQVLQEIAGEFSGSKQIDDEAFAVVMEAWKLLNDALISEQEMEELDKSVEAAIVQLSNEYVIPNNARRLIPPRWAYFEDRPNLAPKFGAFIKKNVVVRLPEIWQAMEVAGVQNLSDAVQTTLVECENPIRSRETHERLIERNASIQRIMEAKDDTDWNRSLLGEVTICSVSILKIKYRLEISRQICDEISVETAHYHTETKTLYHADDGRVPWPDIARELAFALAPKGNLYELSSGLLHVLQARTVAEGEEVLDALKYPKLQTAEIWEAPISTLAGVGGTESSNHEESEQLEPSSAQLNEESSSDDIQQNGSCENSAGESSFAGQSPSQQHRCNDQPEHPHNNLPPAMNGSSDQAASKNKQSGSKKNRNSTQRGYLRTYVLPLEQDEDIEGDSELARQRSAVDQSGIEFVLSYETRVGRTPREMPHLHPGYDIESRDQNGDIVRYIEVKSLSGAWGKLGVKLSETQFCKAQKWGDKYWLYVVEQSESQKPRLYRIQDPANKVNQFMFDDGWSALGEAEETTSRRSILGLR